MHVALYSARVKKKATIGYFFLLHKIALEPKMKQWLVKELKVPRIIAQPSCAYPCKVRESFSS